MHGSGNLLQMLMKHFCQLGTTSGHPAPARDRQAPLLADGTVPGSLKLVDNVVSMTGVVIGTYEPAGDVVLAPTLVMLCLVRPAR